MRFRNDLHIFKLGSVTVIHYRDEVFIITLRYATVTGTAIFLIDDNAYHHRTVIIDNFLKSEGTALTDWPKYFPDLNAIENLCLWPCSV